MPPVLCGKGVTDLVTYTDLFVFCTLIVSLINLFVQIFQCAYRLCSATRQIVIWRAVPADNGAPTCVSSGTPGQCPVTFLRTRLRQLPSHRRGGYQPPAGLVHCVFN